MGDTIMSDTTSSSDIFIMKKLYQAAYNFGSSPDEEADYIQVYPDDIFTFACSQK